MNSRELRKTFLDFYGKRGHELVRSAPLVPQADPTLMFVNAGMVQFKDVFTGNDKRPYDRACSSQKCIRISGKHNDLENVGVTARHHTFFEMLGNFSFGDYFKEEAIVSAWELLTGELDISPDRMVVTVFEGDSGFAADDEAAELWRKVTGWSDERILRLGAADNFWSMGPTGPCGPCSEIHFFHGDQPDLSQFGAEPTVDGTGWNEIWNLVFMQYDRAEAGAAPTALPAPSIDTGAGLERLAGVLQGASSNYDTDIMARLVARAADIAGKHYHGSASADDVSLRVIADHARTTAFLIAEGVMPDKQRREYVLRRVMRRAIRHGHRLGIDRPFLHQVALEVVATMGEDYPELIERRELIERVTEGEEGRFRATLRRGMKILDERFAELGQDGEHPLSAEVAADLFTTYGFPLDLTEVIAAEHGMDADIAGARAIVSGAEGTEGPIDPGAAVDPAYREVAAKTAGTTFSGYETEKDQSEVLAILKISSGEGGGQLALVDSVAAGTEVEIALARSPFYAEAGGQVGDVGRLFNDQVQVQVKTAQRPLGNVTMHRGRVERGSLQIGDKVELEVDHANRAATRRNHSATHLLHWALRRVLGDHAQQKGSLVGPDGLRFDFAYNERMTAEEIEQVEDLVNAKILTNAPVGTEVLPIGEARQRGAVAIFEEKYGDVVRVVTMTDDSVELCGGTHCHALGDIGSFKIISEGGTAAGVRRVVGATGHGSLSFVRGLQHELEQAKVAAKAQSGDLVDKIGKLVSREKLLDKRVKGLEKQLIEGGGDRGGIDGMLGDARQLGDVRVLGVAVADGTNMASLRDLAEKLRDKLGGRAVVLAACTNGAKAQLSLMISKEACGQLDARALIKPIAKHVGGSGGGRPDMAQAGGAGVEGIDQAVAAVYSVVEAALAS